MPRTAILFKTHVWSTEIENFVKTINNDIRGSTIDLFIAMHTENGELCQQVTDPELRERVISFTERDISAMYTDGYYGLWLSNHWILMWFWKKYSYDKVWSIEYDVRISGSTLDIWSLDSDADFVYTIGGYRRPNSLYSKHLTGIDLDDNNKYTGYVQLARYSASLLDYLHEQYENGINGQDELITYSLIKKGGFSMCNCLQPLIRGTWTWMNEYARSNRIHYLKAKQKGVLAIFHPVKD